MKHIYYSLIALLLCGACNHPTTPTANPEEMSAIASELISDTTSEEESAETADDEFVSLNEIRFGEWTDEDWLDNDYYRELRRYIDAYCRGEVQNNALNEYKEALRGKFAIYAVEPALCGGLFVEIALLEDPRYVFKAWVYGGVVGHQVVSYETRTLTPTDEETGYKKEEILSLLKEHSEFKLW